MSLQTDKRDMNLRLSRYMALLSNLSNPPAEYINDLDYLRGLIQIADPKEFQGLTQTWETIRPKDGRSMRYIETGVLGDGQAVEFKSLLDLTKEILILRAKESNMLREKLAELAHNQWSGWMRYLFSKGTFNKDGTWTMPAWAVKRWKRQMETAFSELSKSEQNSDRKEADKFLAAIETTKNKGPTL